MKMKKTTLFVLLTCFTLGVTLSADAAESRAVACAKQDCPGFLITRDYDSSFPSYTEPCPLLQGCEILTSDIILHYRKVFCSECGYVYKDDYISTTCTQSHSKPISMH